MTNGQHVLTSWKEIASYLGKGVRTVQRWETELGLPVRRPGNDRHIVVAFPAELDAWIRPATQVIYTTREPASQQPDSRQNGNSSGSHLEKSRQIHALARHSDGTRLALQRARQTRELVEEMMEKARTNYQRAQLLARQFERTLKSRRRPGSANIA